MRHKHWTTRCDVTKTVRSIRVKYLLQHCVAYIYHNNININNKNGTNIYNNNNIIILF